MAKLSPMLTHYLNIKEKYSDCVLLYRLGDFYEMFFEDAIRVSKILDITLTGRDCGLDEKAPMCGVPYHAVDGYITKLINAGEKVAICEQLSDPKDSKGMVDRDVVRVITPGTIMEDYILDDKKNNYLASVFMSKNIFAIAWVDISTGEFNAIECGITSNSAEDMLVTISPSEIIADSVTAIELNKITSIKLGKLPKVSQYIDSSFAIKKATNKLLKQFNITSLEIFECKDNFEIICAAGGLMEYLTDTQKRSLSHISKLNFIKSNTFLILDSNSRRNLEITSNNRDGKPYASLIWVLNKTTTCMGARMLKRWLEQPLVDSDEINLRLNAVEELYLNNNLRSGLKDILDTINDIERLPAKIAYGSINPRELRIIGDTLSRIPDLKNYLKSAKSEKLLAIYDKIQLFNNLSELICIAISKETPATIKDGKVIANGFNSELDELRNAKSLGSDSMAKIEMQEKEATGIKLLKIGFNRIFGYYIEVPNSNIDKVPFRYVRKQTLANCERFITEELKNCENMVLGAEDKAIELEQKLFNQIKETCGEFVTQIINTAIAIAELDCLIGLAIVARENNYCKPNINDNITMLSIENGRHPVVEKILGFNNFISNNTYITNDEKTMIITGPNMSGKSTYMRQVALICLMAHVGSFVPAKSAEICITDRIFTRIGASDDLAFGQSTFMVEMIEVATILNNASSKSLIILDEVGRGTSTCDGLSIAWAVIEYICQNFNAKTLFSTHYHELTQLEGMLDGARNYKILVSELNNQVIFTHRISRGGANKSFGIEVAEIAGLPKKVTIRARQISDKLEERAIAEDVNSIVLEGLDKINSKNTKQLSFLNNSIAEDVCTKLNKLDVDHLTPLQALMELSNLKEMAKRGSNGKN